MLQDRIISTLRFFDLQNLPLTLFELHKFLIADSPAALEDVLNDAKELEKQGKLKAWHGYYFLPGKQELVKTRLSNYEFGITREKLINKYGPKLAYVPFVRSVSLAGSQALGQEKSSSDIDLFIITAPRRMWTARTFVTAYFHIFGVRRHGKFIANRFCLNHYIVGKKLMTEGRSLYTAMEYSKLRPLVYPGPLQEFYQQNLAWMKDFFPNLSQAQSNEISQPFLQKFIERGLVGKFGDWLEEKLKDIQEKRIHTDQYVRVLEDELSFHPDSREESLLSDFFKLEQEHEGKTV